MNDIEYERRYGTIITAEYLLDFDPDILYTWLSLVFRGLGYISLERWAMDDFVEIFIKEIEGRSLGNIADRVYFRNIVQRKKIEKRMRDLQ
jgi:hypothetical protein